MLTIWNFITMFVSMKKLLYLLIAASLTFSSCSDDTTETPIPEADYREIAVGSYTGTVFFYDTDFSVLDEESTSFTIALGTGEKTLVINNDGETFKAVKTEATSNGLVFDMETFREIEPEGVYEYRGYDGVTLETVKYNGIYLSDEKEFTFFYELFLDGTSFGYAEMTGTKI